MPLVRVNRLIVLACMCATCRMPGVLAGEYASPGIGDTGLHLGDSATHTRGQYIHQDRALLKRFHALLCDVDDLRDALAALPPELKRRTSPTVQSPHTELQQLFALALRHNPELKPLRSQLAVLEAQTRQAGAPADPTAMVELMDWPVTPPLFDGLGDAQLNIGLSQEFQSYGKRGLKKQIASYSERLQLLDLADRELKLLWDVVQKYYDLAGQTAALRAMDRQLDLMGVIVEYAEDRYSLGLTPQAKVLEAQLKISLMEKQRVEMRTMLKQGGQELAELLGYPPEFNPVQLAYGFPYAKAQDFQLDQVALLAHSLDALPEYQRLRLAAEQKGLNVELARRGFYPDYKVSASYGIARRMQDSFTASLEVPLLLHKEEKQDAALQEAYAEQRASEDMQAAVPNRLARVIANLQSELDMHSELVERYRTVVVPQARLSVESMLEGYASGMMELSEVVMALQGALDAENEYEQQQIHYVHVLADLQIATAGAFDPAPYLAVPPDAPPGGQPVGDSVGGLAVPTPPLDSRGPAEPAGSNRAAQPSSGEPPFVRDLKLPGGEAGSARKDVMPNKDALNRSDPQALPPDDPFYQPFVRKDGGKS